MKKRSGPENQENIFWPRKGMKKLLVLNIEDKWLCHIGSANEEKILTMPEEKKVMTISKQYSPQNIKRSVP